jgi:hypothetical protein
VSDLKVGGRPAGRRGSPVVALAVAVLVVAALAVIVVNRYRAKDVRIVATATVSSHSLQSAEGRRLRERYAALGGGEATRSQGSAVFLEGDWAVTGDLGDDCQIQLAVKSGESWQLFAWASDQDMVAGTINSWATITAENAELRVFEDLLTLPTVRSGRFMLIWSMPASAAYAHAIQARTAYACGDSDRHPTIDDVAVTVAA